RLAGVAYARMISLFVSMVWNKTNPDEMQKLSALLHICLRPTLAGMRPASSRCRPIASIGRLERLKLAGDRGEARNQILILRLRRRGIFGDKGQRAASFEHALLDIVEAAKALLVGRGRQFLDRDQLAIEMLA